MASYTTNLNLKKPAGSENVSIGDINNNMELIDSAYGTLNSKITQVIMNDATKTLAQLLEARWTIDVPNDGAVHLIQATSNGGTWYGTISRYSTNYGSGMVARYDGYSAAAFLNNGTVTTKILSYQT